MNLIEIFKPGKHTAMSGQVIEFTEADLQAAAAAYDIALHEAPLTVGHPKDNLPAYGWVKSMQFADGSMKVEPDQVDPEFAELVSKGRFKKISASWYTPDAPANPKPGSLYLRHVAFLGAQPPAIKGLKSASFSDSSEGVLEFADWADLDNADLWRRMREWLISKFSTEDADAVIPAYVVDSLKADAMQEDATTSPGFQEHQPQPGVSQVNPSQGGAAAKPGAAPAGGADFAEQQRQLTEREAALAAREKAIKKAEFDEFAEGLVKSGQLLPKDKARTVAFMEALPANGVVVEFGEGDKTTETPILDVFKTFISGLPKVVEFSEVGDKGVKADATTDGQSDRQIADRAHAYKVKREEAGQFISYAEAVNAVHAGTDKE
ncbi:MAG: peptidase [Hylemonella sp.]|nr:peptidase [Hylemonella sp.]MDP1938093.1 peptidase [Hylemonella sp.]